MQQKNTTIYTLLGFVLILSFQCQILNAQTIDIGNAIHSKPFAIHGGLSLQTYYVNQSNNGSLQNSKPFNLIFTGSPVISIYGLDIPLQFIWSPGSNTEFQQPFNQFSINPKYKWISLYLGYQSLSYNPYTLSGQSIYGAGFELTPGKFKIGAIYGRFAKATAIDTITQSLKPVNFGRKGVAAHIGYGSDKTFFDISMLRAQDDSGSLSKTDIDEANKKYGTYIDPAGNISLGLNFKITFAKWLFWEGCGGLSLYTRDIRDKAVPTDIPSVLNSINKMIVINATSQYFKAYQTALGIAGNNWTVKLQYQYIDPDYTTMGIYSINSDVQNYTVAPSLYLFKKHLSIAGSIGFQYDNLNKIKTQTSKRLIANIAVNAMITPQFSVSGSYNNYSIDMTPSLKTIADTVRITQNNSSYSLTPTYTFTKDNKTHCFVLSFNSCNLSDYSNVYAPDEQHNTINNITGLLNYSLSFNKAGFGLQAGLNYNNNNGKNIDDHNAGFTIGTNKSFLKNKLSCSLNTGFLSGKSSGSNTGIFNLTAQGNYRVDKHQSISLNGSFNSTSYSGGNNQTISYCRINASYSYQF